MLKLRDTILSTAFGTNYFVSAIGGSLIFGSVCLDQGALSYVKNKSIYLTHKKLCEFVTAMKILGKNIVSPETRSIIKIELHSEEHILIEEHKMYKVEKNTKYDFIEFDHFLFFDFLCALRDIAIFVTNPTATQYRIFTECLNFDKIALETRQGELIDQVCKKIDNEDEKFLLQQYLILHKHILVFVVHMKELTNVESGIQNK